MPDYLIAPPGTPTGAPGWRKPPPGLILTWTLTEGPDVAVQRDGILLSDGIDHLAGIMIDPVAGAIFCHEPPADPVPLYLEDIAAVLSDERLSTILRNRG